MASPANMAFRSPGVRALTRRVRRSASPSNNVYVPSNTPMPELNTSYLNERNMASEERKAFNTMVMSKTPSRFLNAKRKVLQKMARGEPVSLQEKMNAGMVTIPKPLMPKPARGGKTRKPRNSRR